MNKLRTAVLGGALCCAALATAPVMAQQAAPNGLGGLLGGLFPLNGRLAIGLTADGRLIQFQVNNPSRFENIGFISGFSGSDSRLVGIDYRVQDGLLYGVGDAGGIYKFNPANGRAVMTFVNRLTEALSGTNFGVDFNPAADRLRIVSDNGQNLRHNVNAGGVTIADTRLNYTAGTPTAGVVSVAYTNNDALAATATTLFAIDSRLNQVAIQSPANSGTLVATGATFDADVRTGFDIYTIAGSEARTGTNDGYASSLQAGGGSAFYTVNLLTGQPRLVGRFPAAQVVVDISLPQLQEKF